MQETEKSSLKVFLLKTLIVVIAVMIIVALVVGTIPFIFAGLIGVIAPPPEPVEDAVYVIDLYGPITESSAVGMQEITPRMVREKLAQVEEDDNAAAVVLRVDSPGGGVGASQEIARIIEDFSLPTVVSMADTATSGGYYISAAADRIKAQQTTMTGSIGVISIFFHLDELYEKLGIEVEAITSGERKDMGFEQFDDEERQIIQNLSDEMYDVFVQDVARYRELDPEDVYEVATGEYFSGSRAKELNLVDALGGLDDAVNSAGELAGVEDPNMVHLRPDRFFDNMLPMLFGLRKYSLADVIEEKIHLFPEQFQSENQNPENRLQELDRIRGLPPVEFRYQATF